MYNLSYFKEKDPEKLIEFIRQHPFAMLIGCTDNIPVATQVPFLITEKESEITLHGHIMRNTDHHKSFVNNPNVLCVFTGDHSYVSASWYSNPQTASTWNYISVHLKGTIRFLEKPDLLDILRKTTSIFENDPDSPSLFEKLPEEYVNRLSSAIVAFEIKVNEIDNVFKLSQNRDRESYLNIIKKLEVQENGGKEIATEMKKRFDKQFENR